MEKNFLNLIKQVYEKPAACVILFDETLNILPSKIGEKTILYDCIYIKCPQISL